MSLFHKMFLPVLGVAVLSLSFTGVVQYRAARDAVQLSNMQLGTAMAEELTRSLGILVSQVRRQMTMLAGLDQTACLLAPAAKGAPGQTPDPELAAREHERLVHMVDALGSVRSLALLDAEGKVVSTSEAVGLGTRRGDRRYFQEAMRGQATQQGPLIGRSSGQPVYVLAQPVISGNEVVGVVVAAISLEYLNLTLVDPVRLDQDSHMCVLAPTGQVIMHPDRRKVFSNDWLDDKALALVRAHPSGVLERTSPDGSPVPAAYVTLPDPGWIVIFEDSRQQTTAALTAMRNVSLWTTGMVLLAMLVFLSFSLLSIIRALRKTVHFARTVAAGDLDRTLDIRRKDEIGVLAGALTTMVDHLKQEITLNASRSRQAEQASADLKSIIEGIDGGVAKIRLDGAFTILWASDGFYHLYGCTREDFADYVAGQPFQAVHPDDVELFRALLREDAPSSPVDLTYRIRRRDGSAIWLNVRAAAIGTDEGYPVYQGVFTNVSQQKHDALTAELERVRYHVVARLSRDIPFEYDIASDTVHYSGQYQALFGQRPDVEHFSRAMAGRGILHPDDQAPVMRMLDRAALPGGQTADPGACPEGCGGPVPETEPAPAPESWLDIRLRNALGQYTWYRLYAATLRTADGQPVKIVGKLACIQKQKDLQTRARERALRDALTSLPGRAAAEAEMRHILAARPEKRHALLVADIDGFRATNERFGTSFGDKALRATAELLRDAFRRTDILARFDRDVFVVLVRDVPPAPEGTERLRERIRLFYRHAAAWKHEDAPGCALSVSMGVALYEGDGRSLEDLIRSADDALRQAKQSGPGSIAGI